MKSNKYLLIFLASLIFTSCSTNTPIKNKSEALRGTNTVVVGIYLDKNGYPQATDETIHIGPGQKIIFAGPDQFDIFFKDQKSPTQETEIRSKAGLIIIDIPKDIFEKEQRAEKSTSTIKELFYRYGIRANGKITDPNINVCRC